MSTRMPSKIPNSLWTVAAYLAVIALAVVVAAALVKIAEGM